MKRCCIVALLAVVQTTATAQSRFVLVPSASVSSVYDDNLFAKTVGSADQMTLISPGLEGSYETPVTMLLGSYLFDIQRSLDHPGLNNFEARRHALLDSRFHLSPHFTIGFAGRYDRTETAGDLNFNTGLLLDRRRAERWQAGPGFAYQASPRVIVTGLYDWTTEAVAGSNSSDEHVARLGVTRQVTSRATAGVSYLGRRFISAGDEATSTAALFAWTYEIAPSTMLALQAGPRFTTARNTVAPEIVVSLGRKVANIINFGMDYWRGESIILGVIGPVEIHSATAKVMWPIRQKFEVGLHGGLFNSQTLLQGRARVYHTEVVASWSLKGPLILAASYGADFQRGDVRTSLLSDKEVVRHVFQLRLTAAPHLSRSIRPDDPLQPLGDPIKGVQR